MERSSGKDQHHGGRSYQANPDEQQCVQEAHSESSRKASNMRLVRLRGRKMDQTQQNRQSSLLHGQTQGGLYVQNSMHFILITIVIIVSNQVLLKCLCL